MAEAHRGRHSMAGKDSEEVTEGRSYEVRTSICGRWHRGGEGMGVVEVNKVELTGFSVPGDGGN